MSFFNKKNALISVSDKSGILELASALHALGWRLISTGGTAKVLKDSGLPIEEISDYTNFPEMLDGRVKTLSPIVHAGLLAKRDKPAHMETLKSQGIGLIDLLAVNFYPFEAAALNLSSTLDEVIEYVDIGGPALLRSAAKNWHDVIVVTDPLQYKSVIEELKDGEVVKQTRFKLAAAAFRKVAAYDAVIANYFSSKNFADLEKNSEYEFPTQINLPYIKLQDLRYGENPHQQAALYSNIFPEHGSIVTAKKIQGKDLSYNNIADADTAWECVKTFGRSDTPVACVIVKHANPCGVALGENSNEAYSKALRTDRTSAFGGIVAFNSVLDEVAAKEVVKQFVEIVIASSFTPAALEVFSAKPNIRILSIDYTHSKTNLQASLVKGKDIKKIGSGILMQTADDIEINVSTLKVVTKIHPSPEQLKDLLFAWKVAKFVKSNAIVFCADGMTIGIGAGQMSRIDSARIAVIKSGNASLSLKGTAVASDAFFPFRDGLDAVCDSGATSVIQPGGSLRDDEVIAAANERGIAMVMTGIRHFRH